MFMLFKSLVDDVSRTSRFSLIASPSSADLHRIIGHRIIAKKSGTESDSALAQCDENDLKRQLKIYRVKSA